MSTQRISDSLKSLFANHPVLFWNEPDGEFAGQLNALDLPGVLILMLDEARRALGEPRAGAGE